MVRKKMFSKKGNALKITSKRRPLVFLSGLSCKAVELKRIGKTLLKPHKFYFDNNEFYMRHRLGFLKLKKDAEGKVRIWLTHTRGMLVMVSDL